MKMFVTAFRGADFMTTIVRLEGSGIRLSVPVTVSLPTLATVSFSTGVGKLVGANV